MSDKEKYWIAYYNSTSPNGYNLTQGGDGGNTFQYRTEEQMKETKKKISEVTSGINNGFYGKRHSEETKEYLRKINLEKIISEETKEKLSKSLHGHYVSQETKNKISQSAKIQWENNDFKNFMSNLMKGNKNAEGNTWNKDRIDIYNPNTLEHKRILKSELENYVAMGFMRGIPSNDNRYKPKIRHCSEDNLVGVSYDNKNHKWRAYISYQKKTYGNKLFNLKKKLFVIEMNWKNYSMR